MEPALNLQSPAWRRKNRPAANHLNLTPLTTLLPREEHDTSSNALRPHTSYTQGRSAPTTPTFLSHSPPPPFRRPARGASVPYSPARAALTKSKSSAQVPSSSSSGRARSAAAASIPPPTPEAVAAAARRRESVDPDFLLHVGAVLASEARDAKGQGWLVTRASSTASLPDGEYAAAVATHAAYVAEDGLTPRERLFHHQHHRWQQRTAAAAALSARTSRRGSKDHDAANADAPRSAFPTSASPVESRFGSRNASLRRPMTPAEVRRAELLASMEDDPQVMEDYFGEVAASSTPATPPLAGADFVGLNMELEFGPPEQDEEDILAADEEYIWQLTKKKGFLAWVVNKMMGVEEEEEDPEEEDTGEGDFDRSEEAERQRQARRSASLKRLQDAAVIPLDCATNPPPKENGGLWSDATWLFKVAANSFLP